MPRTLQFKRYPHATVAETIGANGELIIDTTTYALTVHDGVNMGGTRLATEAFAIAQGGSNYGNTNVATYLTTYGGSINAREIVYGGDYLNIGSNVGFQLQYDPTGVYNPYDITTGSWIYFDNSGYTWSSNVNGTQSSVYFDNGGNIVATGNINANIITANSYNVSSLSNSSYNVTLSETGNLIIQTPFTLEQDTGEGIAYYNFVNGAIESPQFNINRVPGATANAWMSDTEISTYRDSFGIGVYGQTTKFWSFANTGSITFPDESIQSTAFTGYATDNTARSLANSASSTIAQNAQSTNYTLALTDAGKHVYSTNSTTQIITVPNNGTVSWPVGSTIMLVVQGSGKMNVIPSTGITMYMANNSTAKTYANVYSYGMATLLNVGANTWFINGAGVS